MSVFSSFNNLDKRFAWSFLGFLLASIFGSITIYTEFFRVNTPSVVVEVINDANVLDVKEDINELKVFYGDVDIKSLNQTLSVLFLRVRNDGGAPILNGYYDKNYPFNIRLKEGKFLKVEQLNATNKYLKSAAQPEISSDKSIALPEVIMEPTENYTIKILALHSADSNIKIEVLGKIAGTKEIKLKALNAEEPELSFWDSVFIGDIFVQLARLPIYFFGFIFSLALTFGPIAFASDAISKRKRKKVVAQYKEYDKSDPEKYHEVIFSTYMDDGLATLAEAKEELSDKKNWERIFSRKITTSRLDVEQHQSPATKLMFEQSEREERNPSLYRKYRSQKLIRKIGVLIKAEDGQIEINEKIELALGKFIDFVVIKDS